MTNSATAINPHTAQPTSLAALAKSLWRNRQLIAQMTKREVVGRYQGSALGLGGGVEQVCELLELVGVEIEQNPIKQSHLRVVGSAINRDCPLADLTPTAAYFPDDF